ncbi:hypothetical protein Ancab_038973 [Ancistrocladus abbreviatus]
MVVLASWLVGLVVILVLELRSGGNGTIVELAMGDVEGNSDLLSSKREGNLANFQDQETMFHVRRWERATSAVGSSVGTMGSCIKAGLGATVGIVRTGLSDVGSGPSKAVRFTGKTITWLLGGSKRGGSSTSVNSF